PGGGHGIRELYPGAGVRLAWMIMAVDCPDYRYIAAERVNIRNFFFIKIPDLLAGFSLSALLMQ
ncbi:MAG: hypothetical protein WA637_24770, partial [Terriglobales bacterium]